MASASRVSEEVTEQNRYSFVAKSPAETINSMRILLPEKPEETIVTDDEGNKISDLKKSWDAESNTQYLRYANSPDGINVTLKW